MGKKLWAHAEGKDETGLGGIGAEAVAEAGGDDDGKISEGDNSTDYAATSPARQELNVKMKRNCLLFCIGLTAMVPYTQCSRFSY